MSLLFCFLQKCDSSSLPQFVQHSTPQTQYVRLMKSYAVKDSVTLGLQFLYTGQRCFPELRTTFLRTVAVSMINNKIRYCHSRITNELSF